MNYSDDSLAEAAFRIWQNSDQTTKFTFLPKKNKNCYVPNTHQIIISGETAIKNHKELFQNKGDALFAIEVITAHELGHSLDCSTLEPEYFSGLSQRLKIALETRDLAKYELTAKELVSISLNSEIRAWRNARLFLHEPYNKNLFYFYMRQCLKTYIDYRNSRFDTLLKKYSNYAPRNSRNID